MVETAHTRGVVAKAALGRLAGIEDDVKLAEANATFTDHEQVVDFVQRTGIDSFAMAISANHGVYQKSCLYVRL